MYDVTDAEDDDGGLALEGNAGSDDESLALEDNASEANAAPNEQPKEQVCAWLIACVCCAVLSGPSLTLLLRASPLRAKRR